MNSPERPPARFLAFVYCLFTGGLVLGLFGAIELSATPHLLLDVTLWVIFLGAAHLLRVPMNPRLRIDATLASPLAIAAAVVFSPPVAFLVSALGLVNERELKGQSSIHMSLFNRSQVGLAVAAASAVAGSAQGLVADQILGLALAVALAVVTEDVLNTSAIALAAVLLGRQGLAEAAQGSAAPFPRFAVTFGVSSLFSLLIVIVYFEVGTLAIVLLAMPLWLGYSALRSARESEDRAEELADRVRELETLNELGSQLLSARSQGEVANRVVAGLNHALGPDHEAIVLHRDGEVPDGLEVVKIPGAEPAAFGVPSDLSDRSGAVVEAAAGLTGLALQRLELEEELAEMEKARRRLSEQILEEGQSERSRIALAIHDEVLPYFAAAEMQADNVRTALRVADLDKAGQLADTSIRAVRDGVSELRGVLDALRERVLTPGELRPSLERTLTDLELEEGARTRLDAPETLPPIPLAVEILVLETVRGCLANVARHARAEHVTLRIDADEERVVAEVADDGVGFDPVEVGHGRHGLSLMTQRVELARGRLDIDSAPGAGTTVRLEVPL